MKVIFLDIDGVITSNRVGWFTFDQYAVNYINWLCEKLDAKVVISSSWRFYRTKAFWKEYFKYLHEDFTTGYVEQRKDENDRYIGRGMEIQDWLDAHPEIEDYLILDDDSDMLESQKHRFVRTSTRDGLLFEHMIKIKEMFNLPHVHIDNINPNVREDESF